MKLNHSSSLTSRHKNKEKDDCCYHNNNNHQSNKKKNSFIEENDTIHTESSHHLESPTSTSSSPLHDEEEDESIEVVLVASSLSTSNTTTTTSRNTPSVSDDNDESSRRSTSIFHHYRNRKHTKRKTRTRTRTTTTTGSSSNHNNDDNNDSNTSSTMTWLPIYRSKHVFDESSTLTVRQEQHSPKSDKKASTASSSLSTTTTLTSASTHKTRQRQQQHDGSNTHSIIDTLPSIKDWIHGNLLLRATPRSGTIIKGIRYSNSKEYLPLNQLPINNGTEPKGKVLVIDFESTLFKGTALFRIRNAHVPSTTTTSSSNYFNGKQRQFQAVIQGRFVKPPPPIHECVTGQVLNHVKQSKSNSSSLPSKWVLNSAVRFLKVLSPHLSVRFDQRPYFLSPLIPTAQTVLVEDGSFQKTNVQNDLEEPSNIHQSILHTLPGGKQMQSELNDCKTVSHRVALRKQAFNKFHSNIHKSSAVTSTTNFDPTKIYTFEFFQHLLNLEACSLEILNTTHDLSSILKGQPIKCLAAHLSSNQDQDLVDSLQYLWSFDIWHSKLVHQENQETVQQ